MPNPVDLSTPTMTLRLSEDLSGVCLEALRAAGVDWLAPGATSPLFGVTIDDRRWTAADLTFSQRREEATADGASQTVLGFRGDGFTVDQHVKVYPESTLSEWWLTVHNISDRPLTIGRIDSLSIHLAPQRVHGQVVSQPGRDLQGSKILAGRGPAADNLPVHTPLPLALSHFTGRWGNEFEPQTAPLDAPVVLQSRSGRSSKGDHPWFALHTASGEVLSGSVVWSGNWVLRFDPLAQGGWQLSGGLNDWACSHTLRPGASLTAPAVVLALGPDENATAQTYARVGRRHWYPRNALIDQLPVEWNPWWPYEDAEINEAVFAANVREAAQMGFEVCTLDAGWFGPAEAGTFWEHYRGDWHRVNQARFPNGLRALADLVHAHGMKFGMWCEIEGLGERAALALAHPDYVALRDGQRVGCVCFGNPAVQEWAYQTLAHLVREYGADWLKLDFNLDPGAGCNRDDHGHDAGDGLFAHVNGYYAVLDRLRRDFPELVLENCSSGGLRIDLGILRRTAMTYLSDPDWAVHDLQIFWGASTMLAPNVLLHWTFSDWRNLNPPPQQNFDPHDPTLTLARWDYYARISMLGLFGLSQKLPTLPAPLKARTTEHIHQYKTVVRRFVREADLIRLTAQPRRDGSGERWAAFQYSLPAEHDHLLFVFRLPGGEPVRVVHVRGLDPARVYTVRDLDGGPARRLTGTTLMEAGLTFDALGEEESVLLTIGAGAH